MSKIPRSAPDEGDDSLAERLADQCEQFLDEYVPPRDQLLDEYVSAREQLLAAVPDGVTTTNRLPTDGLDRLSSGGSLADSVPGSSASRRAVLAGGAGFAVGAAATSSGEVRNQVADLYTSGGERVVDPAATEGHAHHHVMALVPEESVTHRAVEDGAWDDEGIWEGGDVPDDGARVMIEADTEVTLEHRDSARLKTVRVDGTLRFDPDEDTHLLVETLVTAPGSLLEIGRPADPVAADVEARLTFTDLGPIDEEWDPDRLSTGLLTMGAVAVHGAEKTTWTALTEAPRRGDRTLELPEAPTNWGLGDRVVVPGNHPVEDQDEEAVVTGVDGRTVELDRTLAHDHVPPAEDLDAYVLNLTRNVRLDSENPDVPRRGHVMFMADEVDLRYAGAYELGRTDKSYPFTDPVRGVPPEDVSANPRGRYAIHFHETGVEGEDPARIEGVAIHGSPGWGIVNHHAHVDVLDSVTYDVLGSGFVTEGGNERGSFRRNFALRSEGSGHVTDSRAFRDNDEPGQVDDFGHGGHGFWLQGPAVTVENNVAAGHRHYGFVFWNRPLIDRELYPGEAIHNARGSVPNFPVEYLDGYERLKESDYVADGEISSALVPIQQFQDNTVFASGGGLEISRHMFGHDHTRYEEYAVVEDFTAYDIGPLISEWDDVIGPDQWNGQGGNNGLTIRYSHNLRVRGARLLGGSGGGREDATDGVGINRNTPYPFNVVIEDSVVEGWGRGITAMTRGVYLVRNTDLSNDRNVVVHGHDHGRPRKIVLEGNSFREGSLLSVEEADLEHLDPGRLFGVENGIDVDGRAVYLDAQRPDAVPIPDGEALKALDEEDELADLVDGDPEELVGMTNRELHQAHGIAVHGAVAPDDAESVEWIEGGLLGPSGDGSPPREIWLEAEDGSIEKPFRVETDEQASGGAYIVARAVDGRHEPPDAGYASYTFEAERGEYIVYGRVYAPGWSSNSFWVRVDGGTWHEWDGIDSGRGWGWAPVWDSRSDDSPARFDLDRGTHRLQVAFRDDDTKLDKLLVTALDTTPVWMGDPPASEDG